MFLDLIQSAPLIEDLMKNEVFFVRMASQTFYKLMLDIDQRLGLVHPLSRIEMDRILLFHPQNPSDRWKHKVARLLEGYEGAQSQSLVDDLASYVDNSVRIAETAIQLSAMVGILCFLLAKHAAPHALNAAIIDHMIATIHLPESVLTAALEHLGVVSLTLAEMIGAASVLAANTTPLGRPILAHAVFNDAQDYLDSEFQNRTTAGKISLSTHPALLR